MMTYLIQPGLFFRAAPNWENRQAISSSEPFRTVQTYLLFAPFIAAASRHHEESHRIYRPLESILFDQGSPVKYELEEFNLPHTGTPLSRLQLFSMSTVTRNFAQTSSYFTPGQHILETFTFLSHNNQDHTFMGDYIIPVLKQQTQNLLHLWRCIIPLRHLAAKVPSHLHNYFLPSFLRDFPHKGTLYSRCH